MLRIAIALALSLGGSALATQTDPPAVPITVMPDHVAIHVADLDASVAFYSGAFGLREIPTAVSNTRWMDLGRGMELHLIGGRTVPAATVRQMHLALRTSTFDTTLSFLRARGMNWQDFAGNIGAINNTRSDGVRQIFLQDPDGYWIEVNERRAPTP